MDAFSTGQVVTVSDLATVSDRWPEYTEVAHRLGVASVAGIRRHARRHNATVRAVSEAIVTVGLRV